MARFSSADISAASNRRRSFEAIPSALPPPPPPPLPEESFRMNSECFWAAFDVDSATALAALMIELLSSSSSSLLRVDGRTVSRIKDAAPNIDLRSIPLLFCAGEAPKEVYDAGDDGTPPEKAIIACPIRNRQSAQAVIAMTPRALLLQLLFLERLRCRLLPTARFFLRPVEVIYSEDLDERGTTVASPTTSPGALGKLGTET